MSRFYRWHSKLKASIDGPVANRQLLHLKQGELDGACGTHCALMALMMFGIIKRDELEGLSQVRTKPLSKLWAQTAPFYFSGINAYQLKSVVSVFDDLVSCQVLGRDLIEQTIERLKTDAVCILAINNDDFKHWVLVVGYGGKSLDKSGSAETLLILDPDIPPIPMLAWNSTLMVKPNKHGQHRYDATDGSVNVSIDSALVLGLKLKLKLKLKAKSNTSAAVNLSTGSKTRTRTSTIKPISPAKSRAGHDSSTENESELEDEADFDPDVEFESEPDSDAESEADSESEPDSESDSDFESDFDFDFDDDEIEEDDAVSDQFEVGAEVDTDSDTDAENQTASTNQR